MSDESKAIGPTKGAEVEAYLRSLGYFDPISFTFTYCRLKIDTFAELTAKQAAKVMNDGEEFKKYADATRAKDEARARKREAERAKLRE